MLSIAIAIDRKADVVRTSDIIVHHHALPERILAFAYRRSGTIPFDYRLADTFNDHQVRMGMMIAVALGGLIFRRVVALKRLVKAVEFDDHVPRTLCALKAQCPTSS
ncbi:hypothetical protein [Pseudomonas sp. PS01300]|uniref:hypothetical protein n=1 Tax=Pseudomonas sp. PS01300 TaxID=2991436 RepID=UPI00249B5FE0|nr:hypothetical protein [Pseudomonas sp. PS01300]